jgi:hypothetical protein
VSTLEFYIDRAAQCAREAEASNLDNVRERHLRSRAAWLAMAERLELTNRARDTLAAEKAAIAEASQAAELMELPPALMPV